MNRRSLIAKSSIISLMALMAVSAGAAEQDDPPVVITSPTAWATLRSDSVTVSIQADTAKLPKNSIDFKVVKRSGARSSTLFTKSVKMDDISAEALLGRSKDVPLGGADYLSIEWSVPGSDLKGVIEPVGVARLSGSVSADNKWIPSLSAFSAIRLKDGAADEQAAEALAGAGGFQVDGVRFAAGWNREGLFIRFTPAADGITGVEFAFDLKCGKNAFLSRADRFVAYSAAGDSVSGRHYGNRQVNADGLKQEELPWGSKSTMALVKVEAARVIKISWPELGMQPFDERNMGFSVFMSGKAKKQPAHHPSTARRDIPGTWGDLKLEK